METQSHSSSLESLIHRSKKEFVGKTKTSYRVTNMGRAAFVSHLNSLEKLSNLNLFLTFTLKYKVLLNI
jgi:hypothetical protein